MSRGCRKLTEGGTPSIQLGVDISISDELRHFGDVVSRVNPYSIIKPMKSLAFQDNLDRVVSLARDWCQIWVS